MEASQGAAPREEGGVTGEERSPTVDRASTGPALHRR